MSRNMTRPNLRRLGDEDELLCARLDTRAMEHIAVETGQDEKLAADMHHAA